MYTLISKIFSNWSIDWSNYLNNFINVIWQLAITTAIFLSVNNFGKRVITKYFLKGKIKLNKRSQTIANLSINIFQYTTLFFYLSGVLSILGVPIGTLTTSAGTFSLALGVGAQGFVSDPVDGFFILSENQYNVGNLVKIGTEEGTVVRLGARTTCIKQIDGSLTYIPNRNILLVTNLSHGGIGGGIELNLLAKNDLNRVNELTNQVNKQPKRSEKFLSTPPKNYGVTKQEGPNVTIQVHLQVIGGGSTGIKNNYLGSYIQVSQDAGIEFVHLT